MNTGHTGELAPLLSAIETEAAAEAFPVDVDVYREAGRDPTRPILYGGSLDAPIAFLGRDLGREEVLRGEPLIGPAGRLVRRGLHLAGGGSPGDPSEDELAAAARRALLTNTVPYKPPGNKAYPGKVKERFRPFVATLLVLHWKGDRIIPLGNEALEWFMPYANPGGFERFLALGDARFEATFEITLRVETPTGQCEKKTRVAPLPHPSPLNQRWYKKFGDLLARRLADR